MRKRGISAIIATVLTVLIAVAAVAILWVGIQPILSNAEFAEAQLTRFSIEKEGSFTFYDSESGYLSVRVAREGDTDKPPVIALKFVIDIDGTSIARKTYNVMPPNHALVYYFLVGFNVNLNSVKVIPIYLVEGVEREGQTFDLETRIPINPGALKEEVGTLPLVPDLDDPVTEGLVLYYSFDTGFVNQTNALDLSGKRHTGTVHGDVEFVDQNGRAGALFDGDGDYIAIENGQALADSTKNDRTITFWAKFNCPIDASNINQAPFGSFENYFISYVDPCNNFVNSELRVHYDLPPASPRSFTSESIWNDLEGWEFYSMVFDKSGGELRIYRNGEQVDSQMGMAIGSANPSPNFYVGTTGESNLIDQDIGYYFKGSLDEVRVYNRTLSSQEIQALYSYSA